MTEAVPHTLAFKLSGLVSWGTIPRDLLQRAVGTYTCVKHGKGVFVLGAAQCAYFLPGNSERNHRFVFLPPTVCAAGVIAVHRHWNLSGAGFDPCTDFIAVEVERAPAGVNTTNLPSWPLHVKEWPPRGVYGRSVYGRSTGGSIGGFCLTDNGSIACFVTNQEEPRQLGTLLYSTATEQPIGVMRRVTCARPGYYPRGICVPIPHLDELKHSYPIPSRTSTVVACLVEGRAVELPISFALATGCWGLVR